MKKTLFFLVTVVFLCSFTGICFAPTAENFSMTIRKIWVQYDNGEHDLAENLSIPKTLYADESYVGIADLLSHFSNTKGSVVTAVYLYADGTYGDGPYEGWLTNGGEPVPGPDPRAVPNVVNFLDGTTSVDLNSNNKITLRLYYLSLLSDWQTTTPDLGNE